MNPNPIPSCPIPIKDYPSVLLAHGGGGRLMQDLIRRMFRPAFANAWLGQEHDGARLEWGGGYLVFSTDSYVVRPHFFPGGDIGSLAVYGTVNDLAMCGARPRWLSAGFILEEGLPMESLWRVVHSMKEAAGCCGVAIVAGDTKVVDRGKGDGIFVTTTGLGVMEHDLEIAPHRVRPGDMILVSGDVGRHGMAIMSAREEMAFEKAIESDVAPLHEPVLALLEAGIGVRCLRDLTRGGLAAALNEIATTAGVDLLVEESAVPVVDSVRGGCEILGLDPFYAACEGRFVAFVAPRDLPHALDALHASPLTREACWIGEVTATGTGRVTVRSSIGAERVLDLLSGEQLPRIC